MSLIDTHTHITHERLQAETVEIIQNMQQDGIERLIEIGYDRKSSQRAVALAEENACVYAAVGIHPHDAAEAEENDFLWLTQTAQHPKVVAIGEAGLDYYYDHSPRDIQRAVFQRQIGIACETGLPLVIHLRDAYQDMQDILEKHRHLLKNGVLLHCYSGSAEMVKVFSQFDTYFAFGGAITFNNAKKEAVIQAVPEDRLLLETDCPYMTPEPFRGRPNRPAYVRYVAEKAASVLGVLNQEIERRTSENARRLFKKLK